MAEIIGKFGTFGFFNPTPLGQDLAGGVGGGGLDAETLTHLEVLDSAMQFAQQQKADTLLSHNQPPPNKLLALIPNGWLTGNGFAKKELPDIPLPHTWATSTRLHLADFIAEQAKVHSFTLDPDSRIAVWDKFRRDDGSKMIAAAGANGNGSQVGAWIAEATKAYVGLKQHEFKNILIDAFSNLRDGFRPEKESLGRGPSEQKMQAALRKAVKDVEDIPQPTNSDLDPYLDIFRRLVLDHFQELGLVGTKTALPKTPPPPKARWSSDHIDSQVKAALQLEKTFIDTLTTLPAGDPQSEAQTIINQVKEAVALLQSLPTDDAKRKAMLADKDKQEKILAAIKTVFDVSLELETLRIREISSGIDAEEVKNYLQIIAARLAELLRKPSIALAGIDPNALQEMAKIYIRNWIGLHKNARPEMLTLSWQALNAAAFEALQKVLELQKFADEAAQELFKVNFLREARQLIYGIVTWEELRKPKDKSGKVRLTPSHLSYAERVALLGEMYPLMQMHYDDLVKAGRLADANIFQELLYRYVDFAHLRPDALLTLEPEIVHAILEQTENPHLYTDGGLNALREFFEIATGKQIAPLTPLPLPPPSRGGGCLPAGCLAGGKGETSYLPYQSGSGLEQLLQHPAFEVLKDDLGREAFRNTTGLTWEAVKSWGKKRKIEFVHDDVAHEPKDHQQMLDVYYYLNQLAGFHNMQIDFWDFLAAVFPAAGQMRDAAQMGKNSSRDIVVRIPHVVENIAFANLSYQQLAVGIRAKGFLDLPSVLKQHAASGVQRPHWDTLEGIARYLSEKAGGDEAHQKQVYYFLILLRLIDVIPSATEIRDTFDTILSNHDRSLLSRYRLLVLPEDPEITYEATEDETEATARKWPISEIKSGYFDTALEWMERRVASLKFILNGQQAMIFSDGTQKTVADIQKEVGILRQQHSIYKGDLNAVATESPLRKEGRQDYVRRMRQFYRHFLLEFKKIILMAHSPQAQQVGFLWIRYEIVPVIKGLRIKPAGADSVAVGLDDILELAQQENWAPERIRNIFHLRLVTEELLRQGLSADVIPSPCQSTGQAPAGIQKYFLGDISQSIDDEKQLAAKTQAKQTQLTLNEKDLLKSFETPLARHSATRKPYYLSIPNWEESLSDLFKDAGRDGFVANDIAVAKRYFAAVVTPQSHFSEEVLHDAALAIYAKEEDAGEACRRLKIFFPTILVDCGLEYPKTAKEDAADLSVLLEEALTRYLDLFPSLKFIKNGGQAIEEIVVDEDLLIKVVDDLLREKPEARGYRSYLIKNLRPQIGEYVEAADKTGLRRFQEESTALPTAGLFAERFRSFFPSPSATLPADRRPSPTGGGGKGEGELRNAYFRLTSLYQGKMPPDAEIAEGLKHFVQYQWEAISRLASLLSDSEKGIKSYLARNFKAPLIDAGAMERIAIQYMRCRILGVLPFDMEEACLTEAKAHFGSYPKLLGQAAQMYRAILSRYFTDLENYFSALYDLILNEMETVAANSVTETREEFLEEVTKRYPTLEEAKTAFDLSQLLGTRNLRDFSAVVDDSYARVVKRLVGQRRLEEMARAHDEEEAKRAAAVLEAQLAEEAKRREELERKIDAVPFPKIPEVAILEENIWRASPDARERYFNTLLAVKTGMEALKGELEAVEVVIASPMSLLNGAKQSSIITAKQSAFAQFKKEALKRRHDFFASLTAVIDSQKADEEAKLLLANAQKRAELDSSFVQAYQKMAGAIWDYFTVANAILDVQPEGVTWQSLGELRQQAYKVSLLFIQRRDEVNQESLRLSSIDRSLPPADAIRQQAEKLAKRTLSQKEAIEKWLQSDREFSVTLEDLSALMKHEVACDVAQDQVYEHITTLFSHLPITHFVPVQVSLPDLPSGPFLNKDGKEILVLNPVTVSETDRTEYSEAVEHTLNIFNTAEGAYLLDARGVQRLFRQPVAKGARFKDILGNEFILPELVSTAMDAVDLSKEHPYAHFVVNLRRLMKEGHPATMMIVARIYDKSSDDPVAVKLWKEIAQILAGVDSASPLQTLVDFIDGWGQANYETIVSAPGLKEIHGLFVLQTKYFYTRSVLDAESDAMRKKMKEGKNVIEEMGLPMGEISAKRMDAIFAKGILRPQGMPTEVGKKVIEALWVMRPKFGRLFEYLSTIAPGFLDHFTAKMLEVMWQNQTQLGQKSNWDWNDTNQVTGAIHFYTALMLRHFEAQIFYPDIFKNYRPMDWYQLYFDTGAKIYQELSKWPSHFGLRIVGWKRFEGKSYAVSSAEREKILNGVLEFEAIDLETGETVQIKPPAKITPDQFRWTWPSNAHANNHWERLGKMYADPRYMVVAKIYEEAFYLATRDIKPDPRLTTVLLDSLVGPYFEDIEEVKKHFVLIYREYVSESSRFSAAYEKISSGMRGDCSEAYPSEQASPEDWEKYIGERRVNLLVRHLNGYDRRLDEAYESYYNVVTSPSPPVPARRLFGGGEGEKILREWLEFLAESVANMDIGKMMSMDEAKAKSYVHRFFTVFDKLYERLKAENRMDEIDEIRELLFDVFFKQGIKTWIGPSFEKYLEFRQWFQRELIVRLGEEEEWQAVLNRLKAAGKIIFPYNSDIGVREYDALFRDCLKKTAPLMKKAKFKKPPEAFLSAFDRLRKLQHAHPKLSSTILFSLMIEEKTLHPSDKDAFGFLYSSVSQALYKTHSAAEEKFEVALVADFPQLAVGNLIYHETPPGLGGTMDLGMGADIILDDKPWEILLREANAETDRLMHKEEPAVVSDGIKVTPPLFEALQKIPGDYVSKTLQSTLKFLDDIGLKQVQVDPRIPAADGQKEINNYCLRLLWAYDKFGFEFEALQKGSFADIYRDFKAAKQLPIHSAERFDAMMKMGRRLAETMGIKRMTEVEFGKIRDAHNAYLHFIAGVAEELDVDEILQNKLVGWIVGHRRDPFFPLSLALFRDSDLNRRFSEAKEKLLAHLKTLPATRMQPFADDLQIDFPELSWEKKSPSPPATQSAGRQPSPPSTSLRTGSRGEGDMVPSPLMGESQGEGEGENIYDARMREALAKATWHVGGTDPKGDRLSLITAFNSLFEAFRGTPSNHTFTPAMRVKEMLDQHGRMIVGIYNDLDADLQKEANQYFFRLLWAYDKFGFEFEALTKEPFAGIYQPFKAAKQLPIHSAERFDAMRKVRYQLAEKMGIGRSTEIELGKIKNAYITYLHFIAGVAEELDVDEALQENLLGWIMLHRRDPFFPVSLLLFRKFDMHRHFLAAREKLLAHLKTLPATRMQPFADDLQIDFPELSWEKKSPSPPATQSAGRQPSPPSTSLRTGSRGEGDMVPSPLMGESQGEGANYDTLLQKAMDKALAEGEKAKRGVGISSERPVGSVAPVFEVLKTIPSDHRSETLDASFRILNNGLNGIMGMDDRMRSQVQATINRKSLQALWAYDKFGHEFDIFQKWPFRRLMADIRFLREVRLHPEEVDQARWQKALQHVHRELTRHGIVTSPLPPRHTTGGQASPSPATQPAGGQGKVEGEVYPWLEWETKPDFDSILQKGLDERHRVEREIFGANGDHATHVVTEKAYVMNIDMWIKQLLPTEDKLFEAFRMIPPDYRSDRFMDDLKNRDGEGMQLIKAWNDLNGEQKEVAEQYFLRLLWTHDKFGFEFEALQKGPFADIYHDLKAAKQLSIGSTERVVAIQTIYDPLIEREVVKRVDNSEGIKILQSPSGYFRFIKYGAEKTGMAEGMQGILHVRAVHRRLNPFFPECLFHVFSSSRDLEANFEEKFLESREKLLAHLKTLPADRLQPFAKELLLDFPELFWEGVVN